MCCMRAKLHTKTVTTRMWASAQRDGHPAEYSWRPLFNAAVWLAPPARMPCINEAKTPNNRTDLSR